MRMWVRCGYKSRCRCSPVALSDRAFCCGLARVFVWVACLGWGEGGLGWGEGHSYERGLSYEIGEVVVMTARARTLIKRERESPHFTLERLVRTPG